MDQVSGGKQHKKQCSDGWLCPYCSMWFERFSADRHLKEQHPEERSALIAQAFRATPLFRASVWEGL